MGGILLLSVSLPVPGHQVHFEQHHGALVLQYSTKFQQYCGNLWMQTVNALEKDQTKQCSSVKNIASGVVKSLSDHGKRFKGT